MVDTVQTAIYRMGVEGKEAVDAAAKSVDGLSVSEEKLTRATRASEEGFQRLLAANDRATKVKQQYEAQLARVARYEEAGVGTARERALIIDVATRKYIDQTTALQRAALAQDQYNQAQARAANPNSAQNINARMGIGGTPASADRGADVAAYGNELDRLRAKYNPLFAAQQQYRASLTEINMANKVGAINEVERSAAIQQTKNAFAQQVVAMRSASGATQEASLFTQRLSAATSGLSGQLIALSAGAGPVGVFLAALGPWGIAAAVGLGVLTSKSMESIAAFKKFEEEELTLNSMLKSTGFAAGKTAEDIEKMATDIGNISEVRKAGIELIKFGNIAGDVFDRTLRAADDLSAAGFGSISSAAAALGKALESPMDGLTRLRRAGIIFSDSQIVMVRNMQETGRLADAQKYILDELAKKVGGAGAARDQGLAGSYEALGDATQRLLEYWGRQITLGLNLAGVIRGIATAMDETIKRANDPSFKLSIVDTAIGQTRQRVSELTESGSPGLAARAQETLNRQLAVREKLLRDVTKAQQAVDASMDTSAMQQYEAAQKKQIENIKSIVEILEKETDALRQNAYERAVDAAMRNKGDGVARGGEGEEQIRRAINTKMATEATQQFIESTRLSAANLNVQAKAMGMSAAAAARYKIEQELLNAVTLKGNTLLPDQRAAIKAVADEYGAATGRVEAFKAAEAKRGQILTSAQGIETARMELSLVGQTSLVQNTLLAQLRIKQQLEQEELRTKIPMDRAHLANLQQQISEQEKLNQLKIEFSELLAQSRDLLNNAASGLVKDLVVGTDLMDALAKGAGTFGSSLIDIGVRRIVDQLMSSFSGDVLGFTAGATAGASIIGPAIIAAFTTGASEAAVITRSSSIGGGGSLSGLGSLFGGVSTGAGGRPAAGGAGGLGGLLGATPLGAVALVAGIGLSLFSAGQAAKKAEEERIRRAQKAWEASKEAADVWMVVMQGRSVGTLRPAITQALAQETQYAELAHEARGGDAQRDPVIIALQDAYNAFVGRTLDEFARRLGSTLDSFNSGLGPDSSFAKGAKQIIDLGDNLRGFIADVDYLINHMAGVQRGVEDAQRATQHYALTLLDIVAPLSDVQTQLQSLQGRASELGDVLTRLGMDAGDAALAISQHLTAAIAAMKTSLEVDLVSQINSSTGRGYLNDIADAVAAFATNRADLAALGGDVVLADQVFMTAVQNTIDGAGLVGSAFADLITQFPQLAGLVHESASAIKVAADQADQAVRVAQDALNGLYTSAVQAVTAAQGTLNEAYNKQSSAIQTTVDRMKSFIAATQQFRDSLLINKQLSPLSPADQLAASRAQLLDIAAKAQGGDEAAQGQLQGAINSFLDQSKSFNASSEAYYRDFQEVQGILQRAQGSAQTQVDIGQRQLDALNAQVSGLLTINASVVSVADAIFGLQGAQATVAELNSSGLLTVNTSVLTVAQAIDNLRTALTAQQTANDALSQVTTPITTPISTITPTQALINSLYQNDLHRAPDAAGNAYWTAQINAGLSGTSLMRSFVGGALAAGEVVDSAVRAALGMVNGGMVGNGIWGQDSVLARFAGGGNVALAGGEYVMPAQQTAMYASELASMRSGQWAGSASNDNRANFESLGTTIVQAMGFVSSTEMAAMREENAAMRTQISRLIAAVSENKPKPVRPGTQTAAA